MPERRKLKRKHIVFFARVFDAQTEQLLGHLVDITPEGAMLISESALPTDVNLRLKVELAEDIAPQPFLELEARSLWSRPDVNPRFFNTGFQLLRTTPEDVAIIQRIVKTYGFRDN